MNKHSLPLYSKKGFALAEVLIVSILVIATAVIFFILGSNGNDTITIYSPSPVSSSTIDTKANETNYKSYTSKKLSLIDFPQVTLSYPNNWELTDKSDLEASYVNIELRNGEYILQFTQDAWDGAACIFSDMHMVDGPVSDLRNVDFNEIESPIGSLRYFNENNIGEAPAGKSLYKFCKKDNSDIFVNPTYPVSIGFVTPVEVSKTIFAEMEGIVMSIKIVE